MDISPSISFCVTRASFNLGVAFENVKRQSVSLSLMLEHQEDVETPEKRTLRNAEWSMSLYEGTTLNENARNHKAIGNLVHHPESNSEYDHSGEACYASVSIESSTFNQLWKLIGSGRLPDGLEVTVKGMSYGWDPDGRVKVWNVTEARAIPITEIGFRFLMASIPSGDASIERQSSQVKADRELKTVAFSAALGRLQAVCERGFLQMATRLGYIIVALIVVSVYLMLGRHG